MLIAAYHIPSAHHPDSAALDVLETVLGDTPSGRLYKGMVENKKAASVFGFDLTGADPGLLMFGSQVRKEQSLEEAKKVLIETLEGVVKEPPSKEEVERAKGKLNRLRRITQAQKWSRHLAIYRAVRWASLLRWRHRR